MKNVVAVCSGMGMKFVSLGQKLTISLSPQEMVVRALLFPGEKAALPRCGPPQPVVVT